MMRFNFTGRKKILQEDIKIRLTGNVSEQPVVNIYVDMSKYNFPSNAKVFLEADQNKTRFMRVELGYVNDIIRRNELYLTKFDDAENLNFRIKVVDVDHGGLLYGVANKIKPYDKDNKLDENHKSILPVQSVDLSNRGVLWRIEWSGDDDVTLQVDSELGGVNQVVRSPIFMGMIFPAAINQVLSKILREGWDDTLSDNEDTATQWIKFAEQLGAGLPVESSDTDNSDWLDEVVRLFMNRINIREKVIEEFVEGGLK